MPSSVIRSYSYDADRQELLVVFRSRRRYRYEQVPAETFTAMKAAFSKGTFFNRHIRDCFAFRRDGDEGA
jgi:lysyl-tRNA synthetase class 2